MLYIDFVEYARLFSLNVEMLETWRSHLPKLRQGIAELNGLSNLVQISGLGVKRNARLQCLLYPVKRHVAIYI